MSDYPHEGCKETIAQIKAKCERLEAQLTDCENALGRKPGSSKPLSESIREHVAQAAQMREALVGCVERLTEVSKCCCDLREWDTIDGDWINEAVNKGSQVLSENAWLKGQP